MPTTHNYTDAELVTAGTDAELLRMKGLDAGYTDPRAIRDYSLATTDITVDETGVVKATLLSDLEAATAPSLSADVSELTVAGDGVDSKIIIISDSRGTTASGKTVKVKLQTGLGLFPVNPSIVLDANGNGSFTFGPTPQANMCSTRVVVTFHYDNYEAYAAHSYVQFT